MTELSFLVEFLLLIHSLNQCFDCTVYLLFQWKQSSWNRHTCTCESHTCKIKCRTWTCRGFYLLLLYRQYIHLFRNWSHSCLELLTVSLTKGFKKAERYSMWCYHETSLFPFSWFWLKLGWCCEVITFFHGSKARLTVITSCGWHFRSWAAVSFKFLFKQIDVRWQRWAVPSDGRRACSQTRTHLVGLAFRVCMCQRERIDFPSNGN